VSTLDRAREIAARRGGGFKSEPAFDARTPGRSTRRFVGRSKGGPSALDKTAHDLDRAIREAVEARDELLAVLARIAAATWESPDLRALRSAAQERVKLAGRMLVAAAEGAPTAQESEPGETVDVGPRTFATVARNAVAGTQVYIKPEHSHLRAELAMRLGRRGLDLESVGPGWSKVTERRASVQPAACAACGGVVRHRCCQRCATKQDGQT
jgi:hypothetical protein